MWFRVISSPLFLLTCLWTFSLSTSYDKGINRMFKFSFTSSNWTFSAQQDLSANVGKNICHLRVTKDGLLYHEGDKHCHFKSVIVTAANGNLRVSVSFSMAVYDARYAVSLVLIHLYTDSMGRELPESQLGLSQILPMELIKVNHSIKDSKVADKCRIWDNSTAVWKCQFKLDGNTDFVVKVIHPSAETTHRLKRQIFSNLHTPEFVNSSYTVSIQEELGLATQVIQIVAVDRDEGSAGDVLYSLHADVDQRSLDVFRIDEVSGWVTTNGRVDREDIAVHKFTVRARDQGSPANSAQAMLTIIVNDFNDHAPEFEQSVYNINVSETRTVNSTLTRIRADDADVGDNKVIVYSIVNAAAVTDFAINPNTGDLSIARPLNRENKADYSFVVKAEDQADKVVDRLSTTVTVNILVLDYNDNSPIFTQVAYTLDVREDVDVSSQPVTIGTISATDLDSGNNGQIRYSITSGNPVPAVFSIVAETGVLRVVAALDRDVARGDEYNLRVKARDGGVPARHSVVSVKVIVEDVNDNPPSFKYTSYTYRVLENNTPSVPIATIVATDRDSGNNGLLVYSIVPFVEGRQLPLAIGSSSGVLTNTVDLDREITARYEFMVRVEDSGDTPRFATANVTLDVVDVNDNAPEFTENVYTKRISEDTAPQQEVITVIAEDRDENDVITYSIVSGDPSNDFFIVKEQQFGVIRVNKDLSYDRKSYYSLKVRAVDQSQKVDECTVKVNVTDKNRHTPQFVQEEYIFHISEAYGTGSPVGQVQATDLDIEFNGKLTYFFTSSGQPLPFMINSSTGQITVNDTLDRDNPLTSSFYVDVFARDHGIPPLQTEIPAAVNVIIDDVNDNAPQFTQLEYTATIPEDRSTGSSVLTVSATDSDQPGTANSQVMYTFDGGDNGDDSFSIEQAGGTIRVNRPLNREKVSQYNLIVFATDMSTTDRQSSSAQVTVTISDVNDNSPQFESEVIVRRIYENKPARSAVQPPIRATDADLGDNAKVTFQLVGGDEFAFDLQDQGDNSFILYSKVSLDYESLRKNYTLEVQASSQHMITKAKVVVKLQDVNDNSPELKNFSIIINNYDGHFPDGIIGRVPAFDPDESDRSSLIYTVKSGNEANFFTLDPNTGDIELNKALGSDRPTNGEFEIQVSDVLNKVNATCKLVYRLITDDMLENSVTLRLDDITATTFMTSMYIYTVQALAEVLRLLPSQIYIIDIKDDTEVDTTLHNPVLNISFAAVQQINDKDVYLQQDYIKEQIYRKLDLLKSLSALTILPFDDTLCVREPCLNYQSCSITLEFAEAASFISSEAMLFRPIRTRAIYSCKCPQGFVGQNISYTCDTEINLCYSNPCMNSASCQQVEAGYRCICPAGFKGERCEYDTVNGQYNQSDCPNQVCSGQGSYCVDLIKQGFACHSLEGRCVETESHTDTCALRTATFIPGSYLMFPALNSRARFNLQVSFASRKKSGLLLYNGRYNHRHDFLALELINHTAVFTMSFGGESYSVSVGKQYGLNEGQWHTVNVDYSGWSLTISLDQCDVGLSLSHPELFTYPCAMSTEITKCKTGDRSNSLCYLDLTGPLLVGGLPEYLDIDRLTHNYFEGCMRDLHVNFDLVDFKAAVTDHNTQEGCVYKMDSCINIPCRNQGTCISSWGTYRCLCPEGRSGKDCRKRTGPSYTYYSKGYVSYNSGLGTVQKPWFNGFVFKTTVDNRPLLRIDLEQNKTIEYKLEGGYITFRYGSYHYVFDEALLNDDGWHHFEMRLLSNIEQVGQLNFLLDYGEIQKNKPLDNSLDDLAVLRIWVGGDDSTNDQNPGYSGCIKDVTLETSLGNPSDVSYAVQGCAKPVTCDVDCVKDSSVCEVGWESSTCQCNEGLVGPKCSGICSEYSPCQNGGECVIDRETGAGYRCLCSDPYQGTYCEGKRQTQCPASWWGSPVCGPCNCSVELNYNSQCDRETGSCVCKTSYYKPSGSDKCEPCNCYYHPSGVGGAFYSSCDQQTGQCSCMEGVSGRRCDDCAHPFAEVTATGCQVLYDSCPKTYVSGVWWSRTKFGVLRIESCPDGSVGNATRVCEDNKVGWLSPNLTDCTSSAFLSLNRSLVDLEERRADNTSVPVHAAGMDSYAYLAPKIVTELKNSTDQIADLYFNDLLISIKILREVLLREKSAEAFNLTHAKERYFTDNMVQVTSKLLQPSLTAHWVNLLNISQPMLLLDLLQDYDVYMANLAYNMATKFVSIGMEPFQVVSDNMVIGLDTLRTNGLTIPKYNNIKKEKVLFDEVTSATFPSGLFTEKADKVLDDKAVSGYILYKTAGEILVAMANVRTKPYASDVQLYNQPITEVRSYGAVTVNSPVISLVLQQGDIKPGLSEPIEINYLLRDSSLSRNPQCVYLNSTSMKWTSQYCSVKEVLKDRVVCSCTHLSTYALITDFTIDRGATGWETGVHMYVATSIALFCLIFTLIVFIFLKELKSNYIYIQINVQLCFCLALIVYICGTNSYSNQGACTVVAVLLHFFVLSLFAWIFANSLHLYRIVTEKRHIDGEAMLLYVFMGYVAPGIVTGLSVGLSPEDFGTETLCWLDITRSMIWSLAGPILFCCIAVGVLLAFSLVISCKDESNNNNITTARKNDVKNFKSAMWVALAFMPLTACTWLFGLLSVNSLVLEVESYDYMFSVFTCITAIFSLLAHVIFNQRGREELRRRWKGCQGHGSLEESDTSDKPNNRAFGELNNMALAGVFGGGSESSTTSNSRLTSAISTDIVGYHRGFSSTSSDIPTYSQYGRRRRRLASDASSDSETDSEIRTEREKDIELASSHSSDEDEAMPPVGLASISPVLADADAGDQLSKPHSPLVADKEGFMVSTFNQDVGFAPPPPYFVTPSAQWSSRISESTSSTHGSQSRLDALSIQSSNNNQLTDRPDVLPPFAGGFDAAPLTPDITSRVSPTQYNQHINKSYLNSPSQQEQMTTFGRPFAAKPGADSNTGSLQRLQHSNSGRKHSTSRNRTSPAIQTVESPVNLPTVSPANQMREPAANQDRELSALTSRLGEDFIHADTDSVRTQSTVKSHQDDVFMPPPPDLSLHLSTRPSSESTSEGVMLVETDLDLLDDVNNETQV